MLATPPLDMVGLNKNNPARYNMFGDLVCTLSYWDASQVHLDIAAPTVVDPALVVLAGVMVAST